MKRMSGQGEESASIMDAKSLAMGLMAQELYRHVILPIETYLHEVERHQDKAKGSGSEP